MMAFGRMISVAARAMPTATSPETVPRIVALVSRDNFMRSSFADDHLAAPITSRHQSEQRQGGNREIASAGASRGSFTRHQPPDGQSNQKPKRRPDEIMMECQEACSQKDSFAQ